MAKPSLLNLFVCFLKIGCVSFGGFMSLVSMIETQVVEKRKWLDVEDMLDGVALASLLPGPMAVNTVAYVGYRLRGGLGALVSAVAVLLPTVIFMLVLSDLYFRFGSLPEVERIFSGILPAVAAIVLSVSLKMASKNLKHAVHWAGCALVVLLFFLLPPACRVYATFGVVFVYGLLGVLVGLSSADNGRQRDASGEAGKTSRRVELSRLQWLGFGALAAILVLALFPITTASDGYIALMRAFSGMSLTLFGGGYVFIPMIQDVVVDQSGWLTAKEFIDGIALGQVTPGPILISAAFIGQKVAGVSGALLSTVAIFAPPAVLMVLLSGMLEQIKGSALVQAAMKGIRVAVIALIFRAFLNIFLMAWPDSAGAWGQGVLVSAVFCASFVALYRFKVDVVWVIPIAGIVGFVFG